MALNLKELRTFGKEKAVFFGFPLFGMSQAKIPPADAENFQTWEKQGYYGEMTWWRDRMPIRLHFQSLGFEPSTCLVFGAPYPKENPTRISSKIVSNYALGEDYHSVLKNKLKPFLEELRSLFPKNKFRQTVDSVAISEKVLAREAGLGWIGKNTNLLSKEFGSYFFLTTILTDIIWEENFFSNQQTDHCGTCRACLDACPTGALIGERQIDARKCISYQNIEMRENDRRDWSRWVYGCDICQEVCPWNGGILDRKGARTFIEFQASSVWEKDWQNPNFWDEANFGDLLGKSPIQRIGFPKWKENLKGEGRAS